MRVRCGGFSNYVSPQTRQYLFKDAGNLRILVTCITRKIVRSTLRTKAMALHAVAVEILIEKSRFEPKVALGIAEAIEASMMHAQLVTVPILDTRLQEVDRRIGDLDNKFERKFGELDAKFERRFGELEVKIERIKGELIRWVFLVMLGNVALSAGATAVLNALQHLG